MEVSLCCLMDCLPMDQRGPSSDQPIVIVHPPGSEEFLLLAETFKKVEENKGPISSAKMRHGPVASSISAHTFLFCCRIFAGFGIFRCPKPRPQDITTRIYPTLVIGAQGANQMLLVELLPKFPFMRYLNWFLPVGLFLYIGWAVLKTERC